MPSRFSIQSIFRPTILLAIGLMAVIVMMILPVPAWVLDIGLAVSFALAILMLTVTLFIDRPLDFSAFPTILLASLLLRLALNVSSTKLIIGKGEPLIGRLLLYNALKMEFREVALKRDPACPVCGEHPTVTKLIDYEQFCQMKRG